VSPMSPSRIVRVVCDKIICDSHVGGIRKCVKNISAKRKQLWSLWYDEALAQPWRPQSGRFFGCL